METASGLAPAALPSVGVASDSLTDRIVRLGSVCERLSAYAIARKTGLSESTVRRILHENDVPVRSAACSPENRAASAQRRAKAIALKRADPDLSAKEIGRLVGVCETQALRYLHDAKIATPLRRPTEEATAAANEATRAVIRERDRYAQEHGLWTRERTAEFLVLRLPVIVHLAREGLLEPSARLRLGRRTFPLYAPRDVRRFARARYQNTDHRVRLHRSPEFVRRWARRHGFSRQKADELAARAAERADREKRLRSGITTADKRHARWRWMYEGNNPELEELLATDGLSRYRAIAWLDWQRHPEDWPRNQYPASRCDQEDIDPKFLRTAEDRVRHGLRKALQTL